jgi:Zn-dependent protease
MGPFDDRWLLRTILTAPPLLLSLTLHEFAHARTALAFGDRTAQAMGRVTLNPLAHLDPIGTLVLLVTGMFGWARPVPVNAMNLRPPRLGDILVSVAGVSANLLLAVACGLAIRTMASAGVGVDGRVIRYVYLMLMCTLLANVGLAVFNLLPLWPLDGHHVVRELLPGGRQREFMQWQLRYGRFLLLGLLVGPRLLSLAAGREVFDPIGYLYGRALVATIGVLELPQAVLVPLWRMLAGAA